MSTIVRSVMERTDTEIKYTVHRNGVLFWEKSVRFGRNKANRAGGPAFQQAAREQDRKADAALVAKDP